MAETGVPQTEPGCPAAEAGAPQANSDPLAQLNALFAELDRETARLWLDSLDPKAANSFWKTGFCATPGRSADWQNLFQAQLFDNTHDGVVFVDATLRILDWNREAERLSGITAESARDCAWSPSLFKMETPEGNRIADGQCPVSSAIRARSQSLQRLTIAGRGAQPVTVDARAIPVVAADGTLAGAVLVLHDASSEISLEKKCQRLYEKSVKDALTQVANRGEFDRVHGMFAIAHQQRRAPYALMICDLDHFKQVNDTHGHQAGDEVIKCLAGVLRDSCGPGDFVARYGGEEFVVLFADCDNPSAARRAEQMRMRLNEIRQPKLGGRTVSASFGVTESQPGDSPEVTLRRADRALLMAKEAGRNRVVQTGVGSRAAKAAGHPGSWCPGESQTSLVVEQDLVTPVPVSVAMEKLRGFVADYRAQVAKLDGNSVHLQVDDDRPEGTRRRSDYPMAFSIRLWLDEERVQKPDRSKTGVVAIPRTRIRVSITPHNDQDRRRADAHDRAQRLLLSFRAYLIAEEMTAPTGFARRASRLLIPWLLKP